MNLEWTRVTAPIAGRVSRMYVTVGNLINGGAGQATQLTTITSVDPMYCYVSVPERSFLKYQSYAERQKKSGLEAAKLPCLVRLENETNFPHEGVIDFVDNSLDQNTGTIQMRGVIANPNGALTPGLFAEMRITGSGPYQTLLVPDAAVGAEQNERVLMVVGKDDVVASRKVKLGELFGSLRSIVDGLKPDDRVIVNGLQLARAGAKVKPQDAPIPAEYIAALEASASGLASAPAGSAPGGARRSRGAALGASSGHEHRPLLHRPAGLCRGPFDRHGDRRRSRDPRAAGLAISGDRAAHGDDYDDLSGGECEDGFRHGGDADRGTNKRRRAHALHVEPVHE